MYPRKLRFDSPSQTSYTALTVQRFLLKRLGTASADAPATARPIGISSMLILSLPRLFRMSLTARS